MAEAPDAITHAGPIQSTDATRVHFQLGRSRRAAAASKTQPGNVRDEAIEGAAGIGQASTPDEDQTLGRNVDTRA